jgi:hypothetical protein
VRGVNPDAELVDPMPEPSLLLAGAVGVTSVESLLDMRLPTRELVLEYDFDGCGVLDEMVNFGPGLGVYRGVPI